MKRISKAKKKSMVIVVTSIAVIGIGFGLAFAIGLKQVNDQYQYKILDLQEEIGENKRDVYVANGEGIAAGTEVTEKNTRISNEYTSLSTDYYITKEDLGKISNVDIQPNQPIYANMVGEELEFSLREHEFSLLKLSTNLKENDFVDVRIMYPNGENYIVLSKKCIRNLNLSQNDCILWLNEEEITLISSGIVDTYIHKGAILYTTKYIEDNQEATDSTYIPSTDCMIAIQNDSNIVEIATNSLNASARSALDLRLSSYESDNTVDLNSSVATYNSNNSDENSDAGNSNVISSDVLTGEDTGNVAIQEDESMVYDDEGGEYVE